MDVQKKLYTSTSLQINVYAQNFWEKVLTLLCRIMKSVVIFIAKIWGHISAKDRNLG